LQRDYFNFCDDETWIEGIGSSYGPLRYNYNDCWHIKQSLSCYNLESEPLPLIDNYCSVLGVSNPTIESDLPLYPNPASDQLHLLWRVEPAQANEITTYQLIGMDGRVALRGETPQSDGRVLLEVGDLSPGMYTVVLQHGADRLSRQRVVVGR
jgi:hypothetical protein